MASNKPVRRASITLEGSTVVLFDSLIALVQRELREKHHSPTTQSEVVGAIITAYCAAHELDITERILDDAEKRDFAGALRRTSIRTGLPRAHRAGGNNLRAVPNGAAAAGPRVGEAAAPPPAADGDEAAE